MTDTDPMREALTKEILAAFLESVPDAEDAFADDGSSFGFEWHFLDGSVFWIDIDPISGPTYFWRKGKNGERHKAALATQPPALSQHERGSSLSANALALIDQADATVFMASPERPFSIVGLKVDASKLNFGLIGVFNEIVDAAVSAPAADRAAIVEECAKVAERYDDCGGSFIAEKIRALADAKGDGS